MKVLLAVLLLAFSNINAFETETEDKLRFLQMKCNPSCFWGELCGDYCQCIWPNCVLKKQVHFEGKNGKS